MTEVAGDDANNGATWTVVGVGIFATSGYSVAYSAVSGTWIATGEGTNSMARSVNGGLTWIGQGTTVFTTRGRSVAAGLNYAVTHSNTIPYWVVVGEGTNSLAVSADDGQTWQVQSPTPFSTSGNAVVTDGADFWIAVGTGTSRMSYEAGDNALFVGSAFPASAFGLTCAAFDGEMYVVGTDDTTPPRLMFKDYQASSGSLWATPYSVGGMTACYAVASCRPLTTTPSCEYVGMITRWAPNQTLFIPIHSDDGIHWTVRDYALASTITFGGATGFVNDTVDTNLRDIRYNGSVWVSGNGYFSNDGLHWIPIVTLNASAPDTFSGIAFNGSRWIVCQVSIGMWISDDGLFYRNKPSMNGTAEVAYGVRATDGAGVWVAARTVAPNYMFSLDNGDTWSAATVSPSFIPPGDASYSIVYGGGRFIINNSGTLAYSLDGETWTSMTLHPTFVTFSPSTRHGYDGGTTPRWMFSNTDSGAPNNRMYVSDTGEPRSFLSYENYAEQTPSYLVHHDDQDVWVACGRQVNGHMWMGHSLDNAVTWHFRPIVSRGAAAVLGAGNYRAIAAPKNAPTMAPTPAIPTGVLMVCDGVGSTYVSTNYGLTLTGTGAMSGRREIAYNPTNFTWVGFDATGTNSNVRRGIGTHNYVAPPNHVPAYGTAQRIAYGNGKFVQCFSTGVGVPLVWSWSGRRWFTVATTALSTAYAAGYDSVNGRWLAVTNTAGATGSGSQAMISDDNGLTWSDTSTSLTVAGAAPTGVVKAPSAWIVTWGNGTLTRSPTAVGGWTTVGVGIFTTFATCIATSGPMIVAGGSGTNVLAYSVDGGATWLPCVVPGTFWTTTADVVYAGDSAGMWFSCGSGGAMVGLAYSFDGQTWYTQGTWLALLGASLSSPGTARLATNQGVRLNQEWNVMLCGASGSVHTSEDGWEWSTTAVASITVPHTDMAYDGTGTYLLTGSGASTTTNMARSPDGIRWTTTTTVTSGFIHGSAFGAGTWVAVSAGLHSVMHSTNGGVTWTGQGVTLGSTVNCVTYGAGRFVVGSVTSGLWHSATGTSGWTSATGVTYTTAVNGVQYDAVANRFVAVGTTATGTSSVAYSDDGMTWTSVGSIAGSVVGINTLQVRIQYANGTWVIAAIGGPGAWYSSDNALTWKNCVIDQHDQSSLGYGLVYSSTLDLWFAFTTGATYYVSADGTSWALRTGTNFPSTTIHGALGR